MVEEVKQKIKRPKLEDKQNTVWSQESSLAKAISNFGWLPPPQFRKGLASDIRKHVLQLLSKGEYIQLRKDLIAFIATYGLTDDAINRFFLKEGDTILGWALTSTRKIEPLEFLIEIVPRKILQQVLQSEDLSLLRSFLGAQVGLERLNWYDQEVEESQIKKFKALMQIDKDAIVHFMEEPKNRFNPFLQTDKIRANFENALKQFTEENTVVAIRNI